MTGPKNNPDAWTVRGPKQQVTPERQLWNLARTEEKYYEALKRGEHLWVAAVAYFVTPPIGETTLLDADSMASPPMLGCFICEEPWSEREGHRRCKGEAMEHAPWKP